MNNSAIQRDAARVILVDPDDRVLLFRYPLPAPWSRPGWLTPGGAIEPGETPAQAAVRELREETGHDLRWSRLGPVVATQSGLWALDGQDYVTVNWFFFTRVSDARLELCGLDATERRARLASRWWPIPAIRAASETILPVGLADLATRLLESGPPSQPSHLPWA